MTDSESKKESADVHVDKLYRTLRQAYGTTNPGANGYRLEQYFLREQALVLAEIDSDARVILDLACGSGLMISPVNTDERLVLGIDYNEFACSAARENNIRIIRGDAFAIPLAEASVDTVINCQFLNQQSRQRAESLLDEIYRVLRPGGRLVMIWRNDRAWVHKLAVYFFRYYDRLTGRPAFPHYDNYITDISDYCMTLGFSMIKHFLCFPLLRWYFHDIERPAAKIFGASCFLVLEKK